jgi:formylglycine-generating enzyme required for sulfatase activity
VVLLRPRLTRIALGFVAAWLAHEASAEPQLHCPEGTVPIDARSCVDRYEAYLELIDDAGRVTGTHPPNQPVAGRRVRATNRRLGAPQAYVTQLEAKAACAEAGKRLCTDREWIAACKGPLGTRFPYGQRRREGACNDRGSEPLAALGGRAEAISTWSFDTMNDPRLYGVPGSVAPSGRFDRCQSELGAHDLVGNLHEWTADPEGTLRGGYFLDTATLGEGCDYAAVGHDAHYRDYSTGFRCCADPR